MSYAKEAPDRSARIARGVITTAVNAIRPLYQLLAMVIASGNGNAPPERSLG